jgi:hypothetical protein
MICLTVGVIFLTTEADPFDITTSELIKETQRVRDLVTGRAMALFGGRSRELAMVMTKLDEAELWLVRAGTMEKSHEVVDIKKIKADAAGIHETRTSRVNA